MKNQIPTHLSPASKTWVKGILADYELESHHIRLLIGAAELWDRSQAARKTINSKGAVYTDRWGQPKARPEVSIERESKIAFTRMLRELGLDITEAEATRPPIVKGVRYAVSV